MILLNCSNRVCIFKISVVGVPVMVQWVRNPTAAARCCWGAGSIPCLAQQVKESRVATAVAQIQSPGLGPSICRKYGHKCVCVYIYIHIYTHIYISVVLIIFKDLFHSHRTDFRTDISITPKVKLMTISIFRPRKWLICFLTLFLPFWIFPIKYLGGREHL